jgi:hypothetical protein
MQSFNMLARHLLRVLTTGCVVNLFEQQDSKGLPLVWGYKGAQTSTLVPVQEAILAPPNKVFKN